MIDVKIERMISNPNSFLDVNGIVELINEGHDINYQNQNGMNLLILSSIMNLDNEVKLLLENGADMYLFDKNKYRAFDYAVINSNYYIIELFIDRGYDINEINERNETPLLLASLTNNLPLVKVLVSHGAIINKENSEGKSPLSIATMLGNNRIAEYFKSILYSKPTEVEEDLRILMEMKRGMHHE